MSSANEHVQVLLREAKDQPLDDVPRLVLADWLMDHGDPRGQLISAQMHRRGLSEEDPRSVELQRRERQLLQRHIFEWLGPLADLAARWTFQRGLLRIEARADRLLSEAGEELAASGCFAWVEELGLTEVRAHHLARLGQSALLGRLAGLDLSGNRIGDDGLARLLESPRLALLRALDLADNRIGQRGAAVLAGCGHLANLYLLDLSRNRLGDGGAKAIAESPHLAGLLRLDLRGNSLSPAGVAAVRARFGERVRLGRRREEMG